MSISFLVHGVGIFLLLTFCRFAPLETKTLLIDFSTFSVPQPMAMPARAVLPVRPKSVPPPAPARKIVQEKPPMPVASIQPTKRKSKALQPKPDSAPAVLTPASEPEVTEAIADTFPEPAAPDRDEPVAPPQVVHGPVAAEKAGAASDTRPAAMGKQEYIKAQFLYIKDDIQKNIIYPRLARKMGWEGKVVVSFVICEDGMVSNIKIVKSSGFTLLDKNAVESIRKSQPFPSPPVRAELVVPVSYRLS